LEGEIYQVQQPVDLAKARPPLKTWMQRIGGVWKHDIKRKIEGSKEQTEKKDNGREESEGKGEGKGEGVGEKNNRGGCDQLPKQSCKKWNMFRIDKGDKDDRGDKCDSGDNG
jgi:hypothetical protein